MPSSGLCGVYKRFGIKTHHTIQRSYSSYIVETLAQVTHVHIYIHLVSVENAEMNDMVALAQRREMKAGMCDRRK